MNRLFSRWLPCATLAAWSSVLLYFFFSGRISSFLHPMFRPYVLIAGIVMAAMALVFLIFPADANCCSSAECGHGLSRLASGKILSFLILLVPVTSAAIYTPDGFGKNAILNRGIITDIEGLRPSTAKTGQPLAPPDLPLPSNDNANSTPPAPDSTNTTASTPPAATPAPATSAPPAPVQDYLTRTPDGRILAEVLDLLYAAQDNALRKDFEGKGVELIGQFMPDATNNADGKRYKAVRMFMTCCAADARPVAAIFEIEQKPGLPEMTWIKVTGTATFPIENGRRIAILKADKVEKCSPPEEAMLY
jgi:uncharacterized repeat protein (TIGR03943 family)